MKLVGIAVAAVFAFSAVATASALARNNPRWYTGSPLTALGAGSEKTLTAKARGAQKLSAGSTTLTCSGVGVQTGAKLIGSNQPNAGTDSETLVYTGCHVEGKPGCEARTKGGANAEEIVTHALSSKLGYKTKGGAESESDNTLTLFTPASGSVFVEIELKKVTESCPSFTTATVEGSVAVENVEGSTGKTVHVIKAPATPIVEFWSNNGATPEETKPSLTVFGFINSSYVGEAEIELNPSENWAVKGK
jgi:hypothetical protein